MDHAAPHPPDPAGLIAPEGAPDGVFGLIAWTAETIRWLQEENARVAELEQGCRATLESDRALLLGELDDARRAAEAALERAVAAEAETREARTQVRLAVSICKETLARERAAIARADAAEQRAHEAEEWLKRISRTRQADAPPIEKG